MGMKLPPASGWSLNLLALLKNEWVNYNLLTLKVIDSYLYYDDRIISTSPPY
jgi:hypothetical protein